MHTEHYEEEAMRLITNLLEATHKRHLRTLLPPQATKCLKHKSIGCGYRPDRSTHNKRLATKIDRAPDLRIFIHTLLNY